MAPSCLWFSHILFPRCKPLSTAPSTPHASSRTHRSCGKGAGGPVDSLGRALSHPGLCSQFFTSGGKEASHKVSYKNETPSPLQLGLVQKRTDRGQAVPSAPSYPQGTSPGCGLLRGPGAACGCRQVTVAFLQSFGDSWQRDDLGQAF